MTNIIDLDTNKAGKYIAEAITTFLNDPPDSDYQAGFLAALVLVAQEGVGRSHDARVQAADKLVTAWFGSTS